MDQETGYGTISSTISVKVYELTVFTGYGTISSTISVKVYDLTVLQKKNVLQRYHFRGNRTQRKNTGSMILEQNEDLNFQHTITFQLERVRSHWKD